mmetsp:Transcript_23815/g.59127  ORF Transcript_23815/g.59127 Transcript_23815/m.59127 type:complete len:323 (+) Transcript_23815:764-1732(+)
MPPGKATHDSTQAYIELAQHDADVGSSRIWDVDALQEGWAQLDEDKLRREQLAHGRAQVVQQLAGLWEDVALQGGQLQARRGRLRPPVRPLAARPEEKVVQVGQLLGDEVERAGANGDLAHVELAKPSSEEVHSTLRCGVEPLKAHERRRPRASRPSLEAHLSLREASQLEGVVDTGQPVAGQQRVVLQGRVDMLGEPRQPAADELVGELHAEEGVHRALHPLEQHRGGGGVHDGGRERLPAEAHVLLSDLAGGRVERALLLVAPRLHERTERQQRLLERLAVPQRPEPSLRAAHLAPQREELGEGVDALRRLRPRVRRVCA